MNNNPEKINIEDFFKAKINCGTITKIEDFPEARKPSYKIWVNFGEELGIKQTSAQITDIYSKEDLLGKQILAVTNFPIKRIAGFKSEFLTLGVDSPEGVVILQPERKVENGMRVY
ncbi:MAG: tRNA-binding protein [Candidatus Hodarchaeales archaeon]|jgi:tRNA-binding protein